MEKLWAPWRLEYILSDKDKTKGCVFCGIKEIDEEEGLTGRLILKKLKNCFIMMNLYPYNNGHLMVVPYEHADSLEKLSLETSGELTTAVSRSLVVLKKHLSPEGFNIGMNLGKVAGAGIEGHLHWHIVPRWLGDVNFMPVLSETRVIPQHIQESYHQLKPLFDEIYPEVVAKLS
ncbi:MAG: HIT domain-containing protein [bacterium]